MNSERSQEVGLLLGWFRNASAGGNYHADLAALMDPWTGGAVSRWGGSGVDGGPAGCDEAAIELPVVWSVESAHNHIMHGALESVSSSNRTTSTVPAMDTLNRRRAAAVSSSSPPVECWNIAEKNVETAKTYLRTTAAGLSQFLRS